MNKKVLLLALISILMLSGCALIKSSNEQNFNTIASIGSANFEAYGAEKVDVLGMAATKVDGRCSAVDFFEYITKIYPNADDMINVRMEETEIKQGVVASYSCEYSGLAVAYTPLSLDEAKKWQKPKDVAPNQPEVVVQARVEDSASICVPCTCVTCGCQPCGCINRNNYYNPNNQ